MIDHAVKEKRIKELEAYREAHRLTVPVNAVDDFVTFFAKGWDEAFNMGVEQGMIIGLRSVPIKFDNREE